MANAGLAKLSIYFTVGKWIAGCISSEVVLRVDVCDIMGCYCVLFGYVASTNGERQCTCSYLNHC